MEYLENKKSESKKVWLIAFLFVCLTLLDQLSKLEASNIFTNSRFAFSLPVPVWLMYLIYAAVIWGLVYYTLTHYRNFSKLTSVALTLIFAGALSNIVERIFLGYVRDFIFITFYRWVGVYNFADGYIILGIIILLFKPGGRTGPPTANNK